MPTPALLLIIATLLPLAAFVILVFIGKRMGSPLAGVVATLFVAGSCAASLWAMISWLLRPDGSPWGYDIGPINLPYAWIPVGVWPGQTHPGYLDIGVYIDSLTIVMFNMVTLVSMLIFLFSIGYMRQDQRFARFFTYMSLFEFSMLGLVIGGTLLQLLIFWELVGLCSYLLIGFWYERKSASNAAIKAFVVNRVGDFGFLIGLGILFYHLGNCTLPDMWAALGGAGSGGDIVLKTGVTISAGLLTIMGIGLFFGAVGKSAQFPLHVWLPDAMEGPTPVSALIHAATMVAAGVYLLGRIFPVLTPDAKLFIAIIGCTTLTMAALIAIAQSDIKKVLAYSTLSQLGYMILAMGVGSWIGGLFHLITHSFFKALLFLGSGSVIHAARHEQELPQYGGLIRKIPITGITFAIAVLAIAGFGFGGYGFAGYYSKDMLLAQAGAFGHLAGHLGRSHWYWLLFALPIIIAYVTPFYMTRCWMLTFWGKPRNKHVYEHARELPIMWVPLAALAALSIIGGSALGVKELLAAAIKESHQYCLKIDAKFDGFGTIWPAELPGHRQNKLEATDTPEHAPEPLTSSQQLHLEGEHTMHKGLANGWAWLIGIVLGVAVYWNGYAAANVLLLIPPLRWIHTWLYRRMYFDELYFSVFVAITVAASKLSAVFDKYVIDGVVNFFGWFVKKAAVAVGLHDQYVIDGAVNGLAELSQGLGAAVRAPQTGRIRLYVTVLFGVASLGLAGAIIVALSR